MKEKITVLLVDDEQDTLQSMKISLEDRGYQMLTASSGMEALDLLGKSASPDLIMTDLRMRPMNGFELYQKVKAIPAHAAPPFFFLTAVDDFLAQKYGHTLGVDAYITKPVELDNLDKMIRERLARKS